MTLCQLFNHQNTKLLQKFPQNEICFKFAYTSVRAFFFNLNLTLHGPSLSTVEAEIYGVHYYQSSSIAFDETSSYWSAQKSS